MKQLYFLIIFSATLFFFSCNKKVDLSDYTLKGAVFGTTYKITYLNADRNYQKDIDSLFLKINNSLSTYLPNSAISKINQGDTAVVVDDYFIEVFKKSKRIFKETNGYFDPTVGNLVNAWGFGPENQKKDLTEDEVKASMQFVGLQMVSLKHHQIKKKYPEIYLDFNSIAKGFGIDVVARFLEGNSIQSYLIEIGGEIRTKGLKKENKPWVVKLVDPINTDAGFKKINLSNRSMATSGNYRKFRITDSGKKYVHTINPITGLAKESNMLSASVIASLDCADVDAYATAFMAMGLEKTKSFLKYNPQLKVVLLYVNKDNNLEEYSNYTYD